MARRRTAPPRTVLPWTVLAWMVPLDGAGEVIEADGVVLAVPPAVAARLAPAGTVSTGTVGEPTATGNGHGLLGQPGPEQWRELATSPIVNVHVIYDRRVTRLPFAAAVDSPVQWVFDGPARRGCGRGSISRCRCRRPTATWTSRRRPCGSGSCPP